MNDRQRSGDHGMTLPVLPEIVAQKYQRLREILATWNSVLVAFSGGVDSTLLLRVASEVLPGEVCAVYEDSPLNPVREGEAARRLAEDLGVPLRVVTSESDDPRLTRNDRDRCYWCKHGLFSRLVSIAADGGFQQVVEGSNVDDLSDYRPGRRALQELNIPSPLLMAGLSKGEIRTLALALELPNWNKPAQACLASRIPYETSITPELLRQVETAEEVLREMGFSRYRVRHHGAVARIEVDQSEFFRILDDKIRESIVEGIRRAGYSYVTLDLAGYRTGSMNAVLFNAISSENEI
ncbi:MAG TPA: ATP-dependent sacrificial sulfur transferase LarE [Atribacteraceae bacterium]|nr:ATP-dependent sacrificial sulfur transferase LarE [Atribacteraceae bacterium]